MNKYRTALLCRGPGAAAALRSLLAAGLETEIWYQDQIADLDFEPRNEVQSLLRPDQIIEKVNSNRALLRLLAERPWLKVLVCMFYTKIIGPEVLARVSVVNLHPSPLPLYRGPHPLPWMLINGEQRGAVSYHLMTSEVDAGPILAAPAFEIGAEDCYTDVLRAVFRHTAEHTGTVVREYLSGGLSPLPQNDALATYVAKRCPEDGLIDWSCSALTISRFVRALCPPLPGAFSYFRGRKVILRRCEVIEEFAAFTGRIPGQLVTCKGRLAALTGDSGLAIGSLVDAASGEELSESLRVNERFSSAPDER